MIPHVSYSRYGSSHNVSGLVQTQRMVGKARRLIAHLHAGMPLAMLTGISGRLTEVIEDGQADGSIRHALPATTTANALAWMVERVCQQNLPTKPAAFDAELADTLTEIVWGALYLKPTPRSGALPPSTSIAPNEPSRRRAPRADATRQAALRSTGP